LQYPNLLRHLTKNLLRQLLHRPKPSRQTQDIKHPRRQLHLHQTLQNLCQHRPKNRVRLKGKALYGAPGLVHFSHLQLRNNFINGQEVKDLTVIKKFMKI